VRYIENPSANLVSHCSGTQDGHGGHAQEHYEEMRQIAQEEIAKVIPEIYREAYAQAMNDLLQALRADITTVVDIALESGENIFHDARTRQALMNNLYETVIKNMQKEYTI
jgi:hypothetical protein